MPSDTMPHHSLYHANTHTVENQPPELSDYNLYTQDLPLQEALTKGNATWANDSLTAFGALTGSAEYQELGFLANENRPTLHTHDRFGHRVDLIKFHPAYHRLMDTAITHGLHASPWSEPRPGAHVARTAKYYLQSQVEAGHGCPITMTFSAIPTLRQQPELAHQWEPLISARHYDPDNKPAHLKKGATIGMAMTEKQGGSDVRANSTKAYATGQPGSGQLYELVGHKYFVSAPMCDFFLVLAHAPEGLSCFLVPRWLPDGTKNPIQLQQLKNKMGNVSNASSETELRGALGWMVGEPGRGVKTIISMVSLTRFDCMIGSAGGMRMAVSQAVHHCHYRQAFGKTLNRQPLMQNVLADLILEQEAAMHMSMRMARALDNAADPKEAMLSRIGTAIGKYWICKRTPGHAYEAMECIGGSAVMETSIMPRLFRESPVNAIWEGSGNIQCLDVLRILNSSPQVFEVLSQEFNSVRGENRYLDQFTDKLVSDLESGEDHEYRARTLVEKLALAFQATILIQHGNTLIADAFCQSRIATSGGFHYGNLPVGIDCHAIIERARPKINN